MIIIKILLYILLFLIFLFLLLTAMPVYYICSGTNKDMMSLKAEVFWPLKWLCFTFEIRDINKRKIKLKIMGFNVKFKIKSRQPKVDKVDKEYKNVDKGHTMKHGIKKAFEVTCGILKHIKPRRLKVKGRYGFEDPYYTGLVCAVINCTAPHGDKYSINLTPVFDDEILEGSFLVEGRIVPMALLWIFVKVFFISDLKDKFPLISRLRACQ